MPIAPANSAIMASCSATGKLVSVRGPVIAVASGWLKSIPHQRYANISGLETTSGANLDFNFTEGFEYRRVVLSAQKGGIHLVRDERCRWPRGSKDALRYASKSSLDLILRPRR